MDILRDVPHDLQIEIFSHVNDWNTIYPYVHVYLSLNKQSTIMVNNFFRFFMSVQFIKNHVRFVDFMYLFPNVKRFEPVYEIYASMDQNYILTPFDLESITIVLRNVLYRIDGEHLLTFIKNVYMCCKLLKQIRIKWREKTILYFGSGKLLLSCVDGKSDSILEFFNPTTLMIPRGAYAIQISKVHKSVRKYFGPLHNLKFLPNVYSIRPLGNLNSHFMYGNNITKMTSRLSDTFRHTGIVGLKLFKNLKVLKVINSDKALRILSLIEKKITVKVIEEPLSEFDKINYKPIKF